MSANPTKWSRKRSSNEEDERSILAGDENIPKKTDWKVKTLEEIRQEKRRRLDNESPEGEREVSRLSGRSSTTSSPSLKIESRSSSKRTSPVTPSHEIIYQLSPDHSSPLSNSSGEVGRKRPAQQRNRRRTEEEEGEILSDISDDESGTNRQKSRGNSRQTSIDVEMAEKLPDNEEEQDSSEEESSEKESESSEEDEEVVKEETNVSGVTHDKNDKNETSEEEESSDSDSDESEESSEEEEEEKDDQAAQNPKEEIKKDQEDSEDESEEDSDETESEDSEDSDSSDEDENEAPAKDIISQKQNTKTFHKNEEDVEKISKELAFRKQKEKERKEKESSEQQQNPRDKYKDYSGDLSKKSRRARYDHDEHQEPRYGRERERFPKDDKKERSIKSIKSREQLETQNKGERISTEKSSRSSSKDRKQVSGSLSRERKQVTESHRSKHDDRDSYKRKRREEKSSSTKNESSSNRKSSSGLKNSKTADPRHKKATTERRNSREETMTKILTDQERLQFSTEVVDSESDHHSDDDSSDSEREKLSNLSVSKEHQKEAEKTPKLPDYFPAIKGCRNVSEEFLWLNRIEEGTYGVVYRARDKRTNEIVALKRLKMEKEKEGFPITSLREINTLLKGQHPNIVTVREIVVGNNMDRIYIVMDYVEHDLKTLMEHMSSKFSVGEVKSLLVQLLRAVAHLHDNWILHRDLKTSNLLLSNEGILKVGDFGLAREYGSPLRHYTPIVVTLWYRAPELLLGIKEYSCPIDLWSVGCIFAELLTMKPLFPGKSEIDQINRIFKELGTPSDSIWPGPPKYSDLPHVKKMTFTEYPYNNLRNNFGTYLTDKGFDLLNRFLTYDPCRRITAEDALSHEYFNESPLPVDPDMFPTWPAKSEMMRRPRRKDFQHSPKAPEGGEMFSKLKDGSDSSSAAGAGGAGASAGSGDGHGFHLPSSKKGSAAVAGFILKF